MSFADTDLIARVLLREDENAFAELVRRYQSPVRSFLLKMTLGDAHLADDIAQATFIKAWRKLASFRGQGQFSSWLFGIACNEFRSQLRGRKELALEELASQPEESSQTDEPARADIRLDLAEALQRLTNAERAAIVLCCQNGLSHEEAAQALDCPLGTVKTNILRGKEKLRHWLKL